MRLSPSSTEPGAWVVAEAAVAYGGVAAKAVMAKQVAEAMIGKPWSQQTLEASSRRPFDGRSPQI